MPTGASAPSTGPLPTSLAVNTIPTDVLGRGEVLSVRQPRPVMEEGDTGRPATWHVVGDPVYGGREAYGLERQFLHAARLAFDHPVSGARVDVASPLPADLVAALARAERRGGPSTATPRSHERGGPVHRR